MNKRRLLAGALSCIMSFSVLSYVSFGSLLADGEEPQTKTLKINGEDTVFHLKTEGEDAGWYVNENYKILSQDKIVDGKLPASGYYVLEDNLTISDGVTADGYLQINFLGKTITYTNTDRSEYMVTTDGNMIHFCSTVESGYDSNVHGSFVSSKGAPFLYALNTSCNVMNLNINGGRSYWSEGDKGLIYFNGSNSLTVTDCDITKGSADQGGAIHTGGKSQCYISNSSITYCYANEGGAIYGEGRNININNSAISANEAEVSGGAITIVKDGAVYLENGATIRNNKCDGYGGGIYADKTGYTDWYSSVVIKGDNPFVMYNKGNGDDSNIYFASNEGYSYVDVESGAGDGSDFKIGISFFEFYNKVPVQGYGARNVNEESIVSDNPTLKTFRDDNGGIYFVPKLEQDYFELTGANLCIDGNYIGVTFHVKVVSGYNGADLKGFFNANRYSSTPVKADKVEEEDGEWLFTCYMESMEMNTPITFSVGASYNTSLVLAENFKISTYAKAIYESGNYQEEDVNIAASLVMYGAASQKYFDFMANEPADYFVTAADKTLMGQDITDPSSIYYNYFNGWKPRTMPNSDNIHYYGASLIFGSRPSLKLYFTYDEGTDTDLISWGPWGGEKPTFMPGTRYFYILIDDFDMSYDFNLQILIPVYYGDTSYDFSYAPVTYLHGALKSEKTSAGMKELARAMMVYNYYLYQKAV